MSEPLSESKTVHDIFGRALSLYCYRCGHTWTSRKERLPKNCPCCHSSRWGHPLHEISCRYCGRTWMMKSVLEPCPECGRIQTEGIKERFLHCNQCDHDWVQRRKELPARCPCCHSIEWKEPKIIRLKCNRCGHAWRNQAEKPKRCPKCQSELWNTPRYILQCRRCGHKWMAMNGRKPEDVKTCPSCKSHKWNETPKIFVCYRCGYTYLMRINGKPATCPNCGGSNDMRTMVCGSCGFTWNTIPQMKGLNCPVCGMEAKIGASQDFEAFDIWSNGMFRLRYTSENGFGIIYLWKGDEPITTVYFHEMCRRFDITADTFVAAVNSRVMTDRWKELADEMYAKRDYYKKTIDYFEERLNLDKKDSEILSIHFRGMGPKEIAVKFGMTTDEVRSSFDRIMDAYVMSGITVDDTVFTDNPLDYY